MDLRPAPLSARMLGATPACLDLLGDQKRFLLGWGLGPGPVLVIIGHYQLATPSRLSESKMFRTICAGRRRPGAGVIRPRQGFFALVAVVASAQTGQAQEQGSVLQQGQNVIKQGAKLLGFATDVAPPQDFVVKSRPVGRSRLYSRLPAAARARAGKALNDGELKAMKSDLDALQKRHDTLRLDSPPAAKALADADAAKKKPKTNAPAAPQ